VANLHATSYGPDERLADADIASYIAERFRAGGRSVYDDRVKRGTGAYSKLKAQPQVKQAISTVDSVSTELESRLEDTVEEFRVRGENMLAGVTRQTRSFGERTARYTQKASEQSSETLTEASAEIASDIVDAGDEVRLQEDATEHVSDREEHEDHDRDDQRHQADHLQEPRLIVGVVHSIDARPRPAGRSRSETR